MLLIQASLCYILKHLEDRKALSVHIYHTGVTSFEFSNCVHIEERGVS